MDSLAENGAHMTRLDLDRIDLSHPVLVEKLSLFIDVSSGLQTLRVSDCNLKAKQFCLIAQTLESNITL